MTLTTKLSALAIAGIMAVIGAPMVTQSAMASGRAPAPDAATTQPKLVTGLPRCASGTTSLRIPAWRKIALKPSGAVLARGSRTT